MILVQVFTHSRSLYNIMSRVRIHTTILVSLLTLQETFGLQFLQHWSNNYHRALQEFISHQKYLSQFINH